MNLPIGEKIALNLEISSVTRAGSEAIERYLRGACFEPNHWGFYFPADWDWNWLATAKGTYVGKLPMRISKFMSIEFHTKLTSEQVSEVGNLARQNMVTVHDYLFDFDKDLDWDAGDFGDGHSCFWGDRAGAREMMRDHDAYAIRFYNPEVTWRGIARAWIIPDGENLILFNGYGYDTFTIASVLTTYLKLPSKHIELRNGGTQDGTLYINSGTAFLIGESQQLADIEEIDLDWDEIKAGCYYSGDCMNDDEYFTPDGEVVCEDCYYERCFNCENCGETTWNSHAIEIHGRHTQWGAQIVLFCENCADSEDVAQCGFCGDYFYADATITALDTSGQYCEDCVEDHCWQCEDCGEYFRHEDSTLTSNNHTVCEGCLSSDYIACGTCGKWFPDSDVDDDCRCEKCVVEIALSLVSEGK